MIGALLAYTAGTYVVDVLVRPALIAQTARESAGGKPVLNVGAGVPGSSLRVALFGPTRFGDVNCDLRGSGTCSHGNVVCFCDAQKLPFDDKQFGAVIASHVLEHVESPEMALLELGRVADRVYVITPKWWAPHTWLHPGHLWYRDERGRFIRIRRPRALKGK